MDVANEKPVMETIVDGEIVVDEVVKEFTATCCANKKLWRWNKTWGYISLPISRGRWRAENMVTSCNPTPDPRDGGSRHQITPVSTALFADLSVS